MQNHIKTNFLFYTFTLFICFNAFFLRNIAAQDTESSSTNYTFETIAVPGVDFLALTASSDFGDYAGYTKSANGQKEVAFTLIDGVYMTYDFPGSQNTYFFALGNNGNAAGYYEDSEGRHHGIVLENGELRQYDFPNSVQTEIYGISDATGALTGNFIDASGVRRGFTGDIVVEFPGAAATYADFVSAGNLVGSYVDAEGIYHAYVITRERGFTSLGLPNAAELEYFFMHGINDAGTYVARAKAIDDVPRTYVGSFAGRHELHFPGSVSTEGWNINQDGSIVGYYDTADGRRHGFTARPAPQVDDEPIVVAELNYTFESIDVPGVDFLELTASSDFEGYAGNTRSADEKDVAFTLINGVFKTYDFPGSQGTYFYALGNDGKAAGHYQDSNGEYHGVILENGELRQYDFPGAVQTEIYGISDTTGALTGNYIDASGVRRGFTGDTIIEFPGALATYADFVSTGGIIGSYVDNDGIFHPYVRTPDGEIVSLDLPDAAMLEYYFVPGINDAGIFVDRSKLVDDIPRTYVGTFLWRQNVQSAFALGSKCHLVKSLGALCGRHELRFPDSVSTVGWNVNQDGSIVGYYDTADGRRHGFIARPTTVDTPAQVDPEPEISSIEGYYAFESITVPGVDYLEVTASNDFGDYAGNTRNPNDGKTIGFTLIGGVFATHDFPGSQKTYFYALGNNGVAAGHYKGSDGLYHGVVLDEDGELKQYDFPGAAETHIYGISDETGALSGNAVDEAGVSRAFSGDLSFMFPGAVATYGDFVNAAGVIVGSYRDADGMFHGFMRNPDGSFITIDVPEAPNLEFLFVNTITDVGVVGFRAKAVDDILRSYILLPSGILHEVRLPGSVITVVRNVNQDGSIIGYYDTADGRRHGFVGTPVDKAVSDHFGNYYNVTLTKGLNMLSLPLASPKPMTAKSLAGIAGATIVIALDAENQRFIGWTPDAPNDGFPIEGGQGYIVNVPQTRNFAFVGAPWTNQTEAASAPAISKAQGAWAFVVSGHLEGKSTFDGYQVIVRNLRTNSTITAAVQDDYFAAATADLARRSVVKVGDVIELRVIGTDGNFESQTRSFTVTPEHLANAVLSVKLDSIGKPMQNQLLQNYPNPFNPETWIPYQLSQDSPVSVSIYDTTGKLIRSLSLGFQSAGFYNSQGRAAYWDGRNALGESVASGIYFYQLTTPSFQQTRRLVIVK